MFVFICCKSSDFLGFLFQLLHSGPSTGLFIVWKIGESHWPGDLWFRDLLWTLMEISGSFQTKHLTCGGPRFTTYVCERGWDYLVWKSGMGPWHGRKTKQKKKLCAFQLHCDLLSPRTFVPSLLDVKHRKIYYAPQSPQWLVARERRHFLKLKNTLMKWEEQLYRTTQELEGVGANRPPEGAAIMGPQFLTQLELFEGTEAFLSLVYPDFRENYNTNSPGRWMSELQASNRHGPSVPVLLLLGRKTHLPKSLKCEGKLLASLPCLASSLQAFDRAACLGKQGKWSLMPGVWRKVVQGLGRSVSNQDGASLPEGNGVWTAGWKEEKRTLYLLWLSLTISDSEMKGTVRRRQSLSAKGALGAESPVPLPHALLTESLSPATLPWQANFTQPWNDLGVWLQLEACVCQIHSTSAQLVWKFCLVWAEAPKW